MKSRASGMSRTGSIYTAPAPAGSVGTGGAPRPAASDGKTGPAALTAPGNASSATARLTHEQVAERAEALWLASGCLPGRDEQNWLEAEAQLQAELKA